MSLVFPAHSAPPVSSQVKGVTQDLEEELAHWEYVCLYPSVSVCESFIAPDPTPLTMDLYLQEQLPSTHQVGPSQVLFVLSSHPWAILGTELYPPRIHALSSNP